MTFLAATGWPEAAIAIAAVAGLAVVISVALWQILSSWRTCFTGHRDQEYRKLVDELSGVQRDTATELQKTNEALAQLRAQIGELEQNVREVDRVLKAVE